MPQHSRSIFPPSLAIFLIADYDGNNLLLRNDIDGCLLYFSGLS
jgi:hypothetical protein